MKTVPAAPAERLLWVRLRDFGGAHGNARDAPIPVIHKTDRLVPGSAGFGSERRLLLDHFNRRKPYRQLSNR
jgi:hypothetical protein